MNQLNSSKSQISKMLTMFHARSASGLATALRSNHSRFQLLSRHVLLSTRAQGLAHAPKSHIPQFSRFFSKSRHLQIKSEDESNKIITAKKASAAFGKTKSAASKLMSNISQITPRENIYTVPNILTFSRLVSAPVIGYLIVQGHPHYALGLFAYSCVTDFLDGFIARKYNLQSVVGSVIDPLADKALMVTLASCLAVSGDIPLYMAVLILGKDLLLGLAAFYIRYISLPSPKTFMRYWDFSIPSAEVHPTQISKFNTFLQMIYLGSSLLLPGTQHLMDMETFKYSCEALKILEYVVATTTVWSGLSYVFNRNAVKILRPK